MSTWGFGITEDDVALDAYDDYIDGLNAALSSSEIEAKVRADNAETLNDTDDAVRVELGLAKAQWECGHVTAATIERIERLIASDAGAKAASARRKALASFLDKLKSPNPRPKKRRTPKFRIPVFVPGDCLSIRDGTGTHYAAAIVLFNPIETPRAGQDTYGTNALGFLDYFEPTPPEPAVFEDRKWLYVRGSWRGCENDWVIAVHHTNRVMWEIENDPKWQKKFNKPPLDVKGIARTRLRADEALGNTFTVCWSLGEDFRNGCYSLWDKARDNPGTRRHRTHEDMLKHHPDLDALLRSISRETTMRFDLSPLKAG